MTRMIVSVVLILGSGFPTTWGADTVALDFESRRQHDVTNFVASGGGIYYQNSDEFNEILIGRGIEKLGTIFPAVNAGIYSATGRHRSGIIFGYHWSDQSPANDDSAQIATVSLRGFSIRYEYRFNLLRHDAFGVSPMLGIGFFQHSYDFQSRLQEILDREVTSGLIIKRSGMPLSAGIGIHLQHVGSDTGRKGTSGDILGLELNGGVHLYTLSRFSFKGSGINQAPESARYGLYANVCIVLGSRDQSKGALTVNRSGD